jgi:hypothetical protein
MQHRANVHHENSALGHATDYKYRPISTISTIFVPQANSIIVVHARNDNIRAQPHRPEFSLQVFPSLCGQGVIPLRATNVLLSVYVKLILREFSIRRDLNNNPPKFPSFRSPRLRRGPMHECFRQFFVNIKLHLAAKSDPVASLYFASEEPACLRPV